MKRETYVLLWLLGLICLGVLLHQLSTIEVWQHVLMMGWGYLPVIGISLMGYVNHVYVWQKCFACSAERPRLRQLLWVKLVGEALGNATPASQVSKEIAKAVMLRKKMRASQGVSSLVINKTGEMIGGLIFVLGGVATGLQRFAFPPEVRTGLIAILAVSVLWAGFTVVKQRRNPFAGLLDVLSRLRLGFLERYRPRAEEIDRNLAAFYRLNKWRLSGLLGLHLLGWGLGTLEIYAILHVLGEPIPLASAYLFHALLIAINTAFFFVPYGMGVFEGGHVFLFALMGLQPSMGLAVGIIRRIRRLFWMQIGLVMLLLGSRTKRTEMQEPVA